ASADGGVIAVAGGDEQGRTTRRVYVLDVASGKQLGPFDTLQSRTVRVALSANGRLLASWGEHDWRYATEVARAAQETVQSVQLWDLQTGKEVGRIKGVVSDFRRTTVAVAPDGKTVATAGYAPVVTLWDTAGKPLRKLASRHDLNHELAFSADGKRLAVAGAD